MHSYSLQQPKLNYVLRNVKKIVIFVDVIWDSMHNLLRSRECMLLVLLRLVGHRLMKVETSNILFSTVNPPA